MAHIGNLCQIYDGVAGKLFMLWKELAGSGVVSASSRKRTLEFSAISLQFRHKGENGDCC